MLLQTAGRPERASFVSDWKIKPQVTSLVFSTVTTHQICYSRISREQFLRGLRGNGGGKILHLHKFAELIPVPGRLRRTGSRVQSFRRTSIPSWTVVNRRKNSARGPIETFRMLSGEVRR